MKRSYLLLLLIVLITSCQDDPTETPRGDTECPSTEFVLVAGQTVHDSITYQAFDPILIVKGQKHETDTSYWYRDTLDLDLDADGILDLHFEFLEEYYEPDCDCDIPDCCMPYGEMRSTIQTLSDIELAIYQDEQYSLILPARFESGDTLKHHTRWENSAHSRIISAWGLTTPWDTDQINGFIGFRYSSNSDTTYGWLRLNTRNSTAIELYDCAIENSRH